MSQIDLSPEDVVREAYAAFFRRDASTLVRLATVGSLEMSADRLRPKAQNLSEPSAADRIPSGDVLQLELNKTARSLLDSAGLTVIGSVREGPETTYVLAHIWIRDPSGTAMPLGEQPQVVKTEFSEGVWRIVLDPWALGGMPGFREIIWYEESSSASVVA